MTPAPANPGSAASTAGRRSGIGSGHGFAAGLLTFATIAAGLLGGASATGYSSIAQSSDVGAADVAFYRAVAENPTNPVEIRRRALTLLVSDPNGREAALALLAESDESVRAGLVASLADAPVESPELAEAIAMAAVAADPTERGAWVALLALAGPGMDALLAEIVADETLPAELRNNSIELLGGFATPLAAETLMDLAERDADESSRGAAFESLRRLSGMPFGNDAQAWRAWWAAGGEELLESTCEQRAETLAARLERADRDRRTARSLADRAVEQLRQAHAELLLGMDPATRQERILRLLENEFDALRRLAVEQVERMLKNGDRIDDPGIPLAIERLLDDRVATLRAKAASLLGTLTPDRVMGLVSVRLAEEREPTVAAAYLDVLAGPPSSETMRAVIRRLDEAATAEAAARALVRLDAAGGSPGAWTTAAAAAARTRLDESVSPGMVELLAIAGDETDDERLRLLLASEDVNLRRAVADGWGRRGRVDALRERSSDPVVYPALASAIVEGQTPYEALEMLLGVPRSVESSADFERFAIRLLESMPLEQVSAADRLLATGPPPASVELRRRGLRRVVEAASETGVETPVRIEAVERLGRLLLDSAMAEEAVGAVQPHLPLAPERLGPLLFESLVSAAEFDAAAARHGDPETWIDLLDALREDDLARREAIAREIARRFADRLEESQWSRLRKVVPAIGLPESDLAADETAPDGEVRPPTPAPDA